MSFLGAVIVPGRTGTGVLLGSALAAAGYFGAAALATSLGPRLVEAPEEVAHLVPRFTATACLPIAASGSFNFVPLWGITLVWMSVGLALTARSGWIGASDLLGLEGEPRIRAAAIATALGGAPVLLSMLLRLVV
jgi:hypothetical protein